MTAVNIFCAVFSCQQTISFTAAAMKSPTHWHFLPGTSLPARYSLRRQAETLPQPLSLLAS